MTADDSQNRDQNQEQSGASPKQEADSSGDAAAPGGPASGGAEELARLAAEKDELLKTLVRRQADFENYRKRVERERKEEGRRGMGRLLQELIPVLDAFERALRSHQAPAYDEYRKGVELIYRQLWDTMSKHGLERIAAAGKQFDPHVHQAIERVGTSDHPEGAIIEVVQEGYLFDGRVLRPSLVRVAVDPKSTGGDRPSAAHHRVG
jgi:molecular chaperone GrpE